MALSACSLTPDMPFEPGQSGNPAGKPKGTRNKTTLAVEALLDGEAETLTRKAIELAKADLIWARPGCYHFCYPTRRYGAERVGTAGWRLVTFRPGKH
jgi:Family of unknown function (DUF5681)